MDAHGICWLRLKANIVLALGKKWCKWNDGGCTQKQRVASLSRMNLTCKKCEEKMKSKWKRKKCYAGIMSSKPAISKKIGVDRFTSAV